MRETESLRTSYATICLRFASIIRYQSEASLKPNTCVYEDDLNLQQRTTCSPGQETDSSQANARNVLIGLNFE